jgi:uncharacterized membrane protein
VEVPQGVRPRVLVGDHPIVAGVKGSWPALLGYNRLTAKPDATVIAAAGRDPLLVASAFGKGRAVAFASDCGPHWAPPSFVEWPGYRALWRGIVGWAAGQI